MSTPDSTALFDVRCPVCSDWIPEPFAPFGSPYVVPFTHRPAGRRKSCRLAVRVSSTGALARPVGDRDYESVLIRSRRDMGIATT